MPIGQHPPFNSPLLPALAWLLLWPLLGLLWVAAWVSARLEAQPSPDR